MTPMEALTMLNMALKMANSVGVNYKKLVAIFENANAEGREITPEEMQSLADDAQEAINRL